MAESKAESKAEPKHDRKSIALQQSPVDKALIDQNGALRDAINEKTDISSLLSGATEWMGNYGIISSWHYNNIVLDLLSSVPYLYNVELEINTEKRYIKCVVYVNMWYFLGRKDRWRRLCELGHYKRHMFDRLAFVMHEYAPKYNVDASIIYGKPKRSISGDNTDGAA